MAGVDVWLGHTIGFMRTDDAVNLRVAEANDVEFLAMLVFDANEERYRARPGWNPAEFREGLREDAADQVAGGVERSTTYVIEAPEGRVGRLRIVRHPDSIEVAGIQIAPAAQGRGIGTAVLQRVQHQAAPADAQVWLEVSDDNPDADRLYERLGFTPGGTAKWAGRRRLVWTP